RRYGALAHARRNYQQRLGVGGEILANATQLPIGAIHCGHDETSSHLIGGVLVEIRVVRHGVAPIAVHHGSYVVGEKDAETRPVLAMQTPIQVEGEQRLERWSPCLVTAIAFLGGQVGGDSIGRSRRKAAPSNVKSLGE